MIFYSVLISLVGMLIVIVWLFATSTERRAKFEKEAKPFDVCALLEKKYIEPGIPDSLRPQSKPRTVFEVNGMSCRFTPFSEQWAKLKAGKHYKVTGRMTSKKCRLEKILDPCSPIVGPEPFLN